jgi:hypothetical protein
MDTGGGNITHTQSDEIDIKTYPSCTIYALKAILSQQVTKVQSLSEIVLTYQGVTLENHLSLSNYKINSSGGSASPKSKKSQLF